MTERSNYPQGVEVRAGDLQFTESSKSAAILSRFADTMVPGVVEGLTVSNSKTANGLFDVIKGYGYTPNGERAELLGSQTGLSPATAVTDTTTNVVCVMYREFTEKPGAHITDFVARDRRTRRTAELLVFTLADFNALPTSTSDLSLNAQDRALIIALVNRQANSANPLIITLPPYFLAIKSMEQPYAIPGVTVAAVDSDTLNSDPFPAAGGTSNAFFSYDTLSYTLIYQAPFDAQPGTGVVVGAGGAFQLASNNGLTVDVVVEADQLIKRTTLSILTAQPAVTTLFERVVNRVYAPDEEHRHTLGTRSPATVNPHGRGLADAAGATEYLPGALVPGQELLSTTNSADSPRYLHKRSGASNIERTADKLWEGDSGKPKVRTYGKQSVGHLELTVNAKYDNTLDVWVPDDAALPAYRLTHSQDGDRIYSAPISVTSTLSWGDSEWVIQVTQTGNSNTRFFEKIIDIGRTFITTADEAKIARVNVRYAAGFDRTALAKSGDSAATAGSEVYVYRAVTGTGGTTNQFIRTLEIVGNAIWDGTLWQQQDATRDSYKIEFGLGTTAGLAGVRISGKPDSSGSWADNAWTAFGGEGDSMVLDAVNGVIEAGNYFRPRNQIADATKPDANGVYANNVIKAWGWGQIDNGGTTVTLLNSFNVASATVVQIRTANLQHDKIRINFLREMGHTGYAVALTAASGNPVTYPTAIQTFHPTLGQTIEAFFEMTLHHLSGGTGSAGEIGEPYTFDGTTGAAGGANTGPTGFSTFVNAGNCRFTFMVLASDHDPTP